MKREELRELTEDEVSNRLRDSVEELENLKFQHSLRQLENQQRIKKARRNIAQLKTVIHEDRLGLSELPGKTKKQDVKENE
ncbi:50S ribosomal protein L29 [Candidatus Marinimicrobia bacterium MT.SAG.3]|nr:50S ribosomal protein L29 [Candidatus Marinimicrobia bacterium MT.SAG.3]